MNNNTDSKNNFWTWMLTIFPVICNCIILVAAAILDLERPIILYDYIVIALLWSISKNQVLNYISLLAVILLDILTISSNLYFHNPTELLYALYYIKHYRINNTQIILIFLVLASIYSLYYAIKYLNKQKDRQQILKANLLILFIVLISDLLNGSTVLVKANRFGKFINKDIASNNIIPVFHFSKKIIGYSTKEKLTPLRDESPTFNLFKYDTSGNQLLVIVESLGKIESEKDFMLFKEVLENDWDSSGWKSMWGKTPYNGSTTAAELRELLNSKGRPEELIGLKREQIPKSIFDIKKLQGFSTIGMHSYSGKMFARSTWWPLIGIEQSLFKENIKKEKNSLKVNDETSFLSVNDEDAIDYLNSKTRDIKTFGYLLTVNTHIPFNPYPTIHRKDFEDFKNKIENKVSETAKKHLLRIAQIMLYISNDSEKSKWDKILFVGDHPPPFTSPIDRNFYSHKVVPFILLKKAVKKQHESHR